MCATCREGDFMGGYIEALEQAAILFPILAVLFTIPYIAWNYHKYG